MIDMTVAQRRVIILFLCIFVTVPLPGSQRFRAMANLQFFMDPTFGFNCIMALPLVDVGLRVGPDLGTAVGLRTLTVWNWGNSLEWKQLDIPTLEKSVFSPTNSYQIQTSPIFHEFYSSANEKPFCDCTDTSKPLPHTTSQHILASDSYHQAFLPRP